MNYEKPKSTRVQGGLPPVTVNFAQPAVQTGEKVKQKKIKGT